MGRSIRRQWFSPRTWARVAIVNGLVLAALLVPVELVFGTWVRPMTLSDLKRFSIPIGVRFTFDASRLYAGGPRNPIVSSRDVWGLRGTHNSPADIAILTVGGSTTEQRYLDDLATWQSVAQRELSARLGRPIVFGNAGVDGQSTVGHIFSFRYWFPILDGLRPNTILFYLGVNDVIGRPDRRTWDDSVDGSNWRVQSALFQLYRTTRGSLRARAVGVDHSRRLPAPTEFTDKGLLEPAARDALAAEMASGFLIRIDDLRRRTVALGARPVFVTQEAYGWQFDEANLRGLNQTLVVYGRSVNYADVAYLHRDLNRKLMTWCQDTSVACFDLAQDVDFFEADYYDLVHNTPAGAEKIGRYLGARLASLGSE